MPFSRTESDARRFANIYLCGGNQETLAASLERKLRSNAEILTAITSTKPGIGGFKGS
jgi:hypothetical protein